MPTLLGQSVEQAFDGERGLIGAEAAHRAAGWVVRVDGERFHVDRRHAIRPGAVAAGAFQHLRADRGVRALVADDAGLHGRDAAVGVATDLVLKLDRMPLRMDVEALGPGERQLDRPADEPGHQGRLGLDRHVLLAAERAAVADELDLHAVAFDAEHGRDLALIVEDALALGVDVERRGCGMRDAGSKGCLSLPPHPASSILIGTAMHASGSRNKCSMRCVW